MACAWQKQPPPNWKDFYSSQGLSLYNYNFQKGTGTEKKKPPPPPRMIQQHEAWSCLSISCMTVCHDLGYYYLDWWALPRCWNCPNLCTVNSNWRGEWHPCCSLCVSVSSGSLVRWLYVSLSKGILCKKKTNSGILLILLFLSGVRYDIRTGLCCFYSSMSL